MRPGERRWSRLSLLEGRQLATYSFTCPATGKHKHQAGWGAKVVPSKCSSVVDFNRCALRPKSRHVCQYCRTGTATPCDLTQALHCSDLQSLALHHAVVLALGGLRSRLGKCPCLASDRISGWPHPFVMLVTASDC